jgi:hypothetical protein
MPKSTSPNCDRNTPIDERPGYAVLFLDAYEEKLRQLAPLPESGPAIENVPGEQSKTLLATRAP